MLRKLRKVGVSIRSARSGMKKLWLLDMCWRFADIPADMWLQNRHVGGRHAEILLEASSLLSKNVELVAELVGRPVMTEEEAYHFANY